MPPNPTGIRPLASAIETLDPPGAAVEPSPDGYDRSSLPGDFMVMIDGQMEAEYFRRATKGRFREFIDGIVCMPPHVRAEHQLDVQFLVALLMCIHATRPSGVAFLGPAALRLRDGCYLEPDLFVLPPGGEAQIRADGICDIPALLIVEVLSPSNRSHDLVTKSALYREATIPEVWFVDGRDRLLIADRLGPNGYVREQVTTGPIVSRSFPGSWVDASWLWPSPRPNLMQCFDQILAGPSAA